MERVHDGAIGDIVAIQETWLRPPYVLYPRRPGMKEVEYQASNQYHFHWLSGDDVPQTLIHNLDRSSWALHNAAPVRCYGMGGRSTLHGEIYGDVFDHNAVVYDFPKGVRVYAFCRTIDNCYKENSSLILGHQGPLRSAAAADHRRDQLDRSRPSPRPAPTIWNTSRCSTPSAPASPSTTATTWSAAPRSASSASSPAIPASRSPGTNSKLAVLLPASARKRDRGRWSRRSSPARTESTRYSLPESQNCCNGGAGLQTRFSKKKTRNQ